MEYGKKTSTPTNLAFGLISTFSYIGALSLFLRLQIGFGTKQLIDRGQSKAKKMKGKNKNFLQQIAYLWGPQQLNYIAPQANTQKITLCIGLSLPSTNPRADQIACQPRLPIIALIHHDKP